MLDRDSFIASLIDWIPEIKDEILDEDYSFSIGLQLGCFKRFTQSAIDRNDMVLIKRCFSFLDSVIDRVTDDVENSLYISYLNHLDFSKNEKARKYASERVLKAIEELNSYNKTESNEKAKQFLKGLE